MTKSFFIYTAIIEGLTGIGLIGMPAFILHLLLGADLSSSLEIVLALLAGTAIFSIALLSWVSRNILLNGSSLAILLLYNGAVGFIMLYAVLGLGFSGIPIWLVIIFHFYQTFVCIFLLKKQHKVS